LLDARATEVTDGMLLAAAEALSAVVTDDQLNANYIIPSVFDAAVAPAVAAAVRKAAGTTRHSAGTTHPAHPTTEASPR
jgi:malate dehydrogenase (oxaloacetate-decarboxylating)